MSERPMTLTDFLLARIAEDEKNTDAAMDEGHGCLFALRVLAECEAKRRLAKRYRRLVERAEKFPSLTQEQAESREWLRQTVADFAAVYADHPDYREEWKP